MRVSLFTVTAVALALLPFTFAKDPADGWLGYATAISPTGTGRITFAEAYWVVPENPSEGGAFYSPWFGIEVPALRPLSSRVPPLMTVPSPPQPFQSSDNLNLIQVT
jgi:hypothetical protein